MLYLIDRYHRLEDGALAVLYPLSHGVQVGREINRCGEYALVLLTLGLSVELLPPLAQVVQFGLEVNQYLYLLAAAVQGIAYSCICGCGIILQFGA